MIEKPEKSPAIGDYVIWTDAKGVDHNALVQCGWNEHYLNLLFVSADDSRTDTYGRQIQHETSVPHASSSPVHGRYWRWPSEEKNPYVPPQFV